MFDQVLHGCDGWIEPIRVAKNYKRLTVETKVERLILAMSSSPLAQTKAGANSLRNVCFDMVGNSHRESLWIQHSKHILLKCQGYFRILS